MTKNCMNCKKYIDPGDKFIFEMPDNQACNGCTIINKEKWTGIYPNSGKYHIRIRNVTKAAMLLIR